MSMTQVPTSSTEAYAKAWRATYAEAAKAVEAEAREAAKAAYDAAILAAYENDALFFVDYDYEVEAVYDAAYDAALAAAKAAIAAEAEAEANKIEPQPARPARRRTTPTVKPVDANVLAMLESSKNDLPF
jgi:hypothetical protein